MSNPNHRGPRPLSDVLGELFTIRGYSRLQARRELEEAWNVAVGESTCRQTRVGELRRGVLNVTVAHSALLEELAAFRKPALMAALRAKAPSSAIHDIRFRVGAIADVAKPKGRSKTILEGKNEGLEPLSGPTPRYHTRSAGNRRSRGSEPDPAQP